MNNIKQALTNFFNTFKIQIEKITKIYFHYNRIYAFFLILIFFIGCLVSLKVVFVWFR